MKKETFILILRWIAVLPAVVLTNMLLNRVVYLILKLFDVEIFGSVYLYSADTISSIFITIILLVFAVAENMAFVRVGTFIVPQKAKRVVSITLALLKTFGGVSVLGQLMMLTGDIKFFDVLPIMVGTITALLCVEGKENKIEEQSAEAGDGSIFASSNREKAIVAIILFYLFVIYAR